MPTTADIPLYQSNQARYPLRIFASEGALPAELPAVGYGQLVMVTTAEGVRAKVRLADGTFVNLYTQNTTVDETVTNNNYIYNMEDLPPAANLFNGAIPHVVAGTTNTWSWSDIASLLLGKGVKAYREGVDVVASRAVSSSDFNSYLNCTAALTLTLPSLTVNKFSELEIARNTSSAVNLAVSTGVTVNGLTNTNIAITKQYGVIVLKCVGTNLYAAYGDL